MVPLVFFIFSCEVKNPSESDDVVPSIENLNPMDILYLYSDTLLTLSVRVADPQGIDDIGHVYAIWNLSDNNISFRRDTLFDNGKGEDIIPRNGVYTRRISTGFLLTVGEHVCLSLYAVDHEGNESVVRKYNLTLFHTYRRDTTGQPNTPPELFDLQAPSSINRNMAEPILLTVAVRDSQGLSDIHSVFFNTYKPNGSPSSGNPLYMYDNGGSEYGDASAADGIYSRIITITAANDTGNYRFEFFARDFSDSLSQPLIHIMKVYHALE